MTDTAPAIEDPAGKFSAFAKTHGIFAALTVALLCFGGYILNSFHTQTQTRLDMQDQKINEQQEFIQTTLMVANAKTTEVLERTARVLERIEGSN